MERWPTQSEAAEQLFQTPGAPAMWLPVVGVFGLLVPNGLFFSWLIVDFISMGDVFADRLAFAFVLDAFMAFALLGYLFAAHPIDPVRWYWFVLLALIGGLGFAVPSIYLGKSPRSFQLFGGNSAWRVAGVPDRLIVSIISRHRCETLRFGSRSH
jgi:hypothetical protein